MVFLLTVEVTALIHVGINDGLQATIVVIRPPKPAQMTFAQWQAIRRRDPKIGYPVEIRGLEGEDGQKVDLHRGKRPSALLVIDDCSRCVLDSLRTWEGLQRQYPKVRFYVLTPSGTQASAVAFRHQHGLSVPFAFDPGGYNAKRLNAFFQPRAYLIDKQGKLLYAQPPEERTTGMMRSLEGLLQGKEITEGENFGEHKEG
jgi:hypothetical protein